MAIMKELREAMEGKEVHIFLFYEFIGMVIYSFAFNYMKFPAEPDSLSYVLFIISLWSWDRSCANFNFGITIAEAFANIKSIKASWAKSVVIILTQLVGGLAGMGLCAISSKITHTNNTKDVYPPVPYICPNFGNIDRCD